VGSHPALDVAGYHPHCILVILFGIAWAVGLANQPATAIAILIIFGTVSLFFSDKCYRYLELFDWRFRAIYFATLASLVITLAIYSTGALQDVSTFWGAVFASWVSAVIFFAFVGAIVATVSVFQPEKESLETRARILFRRESGPHIDYIVSKIRSTFEHYVETTRTKIAIERYHDGEKKYRLRSEDKSTVRSFIPDAKTSYSSFIRMTEVQNPPPGEQSNRLLYVRVNGTPQAGEDFVDHIERNFSIEIEPFGACLVEHQINNWHLADVEPYEHTARRYTHTLTVEMENLLPRIVKISRKMPGSPNWNELEIQPGQSITVITLHDLTPESTAYEFKILAP
jgi:hypothetical protein